MTNQRPLTKEEVKIGNKYFYTIIPVVLIVGLILVVLHYATSLPPIARIAGAVIACVVALIFSRTYVQVKKDLNRGVAKDKEGTVVQKIKLGGGRSTGSGIGVSRGGGRSKTTSYIICIDDEKFHIRARHYKKVTKGDKVRLTYLPISMFILGIDKH